MSKEKAQLDLKPMSIRGTTVTLYQLMFLHWVTIYNTGKEYSFLLPNLLAIDQFPAA